MGIRDDILCHMSSPPRSMLSCAPRKVQLQTVYETFWPHAPTCTWKNLVWNRISEPRVSFCMWLLCHDRLPLKTRLLRWGVVDNDVCVLCKSSSETRDHLFGSCVFTKSLFDQVLHVLNIHTPIQSFGENLSLFGHAIRTASSLFNIRAAIVCSILAGVWMTRNQVVFHQMQVHVPTIVKSIGSNLLIRLGCKVLNKNRHCMGNYPCP